MSEQERPEYPPFAPSPCVVEVKPHGRLWVVVTSNTVGAIDISKSQSKAVRAGKDYAAKHGGKLLVYREDGSVRSLDTFPAPPPPGDSLESPRRTSERIPRTAP